MPKSRIKVVILFLLLTGKLLNVHAQKKQIENLYNYDLQVIHFGFLLGVNNFNFTVKPTPNFYDIDSLYSITSEPALGFSLGIVSNLHLGDNFDLRFLPTLSFGERSMVYRVKDNALDSIVGALDTHDPRSSGLDVVVRDRLRLWEGAVTCSWSVTSDAVQAIDGAAAKDIGDIVGEAVTNAVRHGQADEVRVDVALDGALVVVRVLDNGTGPVGARHPGAGLSLLARAGIPWTLERVGAWTQFTVRVPGGVLETEQERVSDVRWP